MHKDIPSLPLLPRLTVVGAGPGAADLITLRAVNVLKTADVVLYDALINPALLKHAPNAQHIFVGKRRGNYRYTQEEINELIVKNANAFGHVVRLKGGDPFIFGRGAEEMDYAKRNGLLTEIVPGISSALAVPAMSNIPLTKRGIAESFWVITGTTKERKLSEDVYYAAKSSATVVILMGMSKLPQIAELFAAAGKSDLPVAVIQNGTTLNENSVIATVDTIVAAVNKAKIANPAVIVIGEVATNNAQLQAIKATYKHQIAE